MYYINGSHYCISETNSDMKKLSTDILRTFQSTQMICWSNLCFILFVLQRNWWREEEIKSRTNRLCHLKCWRRSEDVPKMKTKHSQNIKQETANKGNFLKRPIFPEVLFVFCFQVQFQSPRNEKLQENARPAWSSLTKSQNWREESWIIDDG